MPYLLLVIGFLFLFFSLLMLKNPLWNELDLSILVWLSSQRHENIITIGQILSTLGGMPFVLFFISLWCLRLVWYKNYTKLLFISLGLFGSITTVWILKFLINRPRPPEIYHLVENYGASFPSAHSCYAAALGSLILLSSYKQPYPDFWSSIAITWFILMGMSRVYLGVHYPSDVLSGLGISFIWVALLYLFLNKYRIYPTNKFLNKHLN